MDIRRGRRALAEARAGVQAPSRADLGLLEMLNEDRDWECSEQRAMC